MRGLKEIIYSVIDGTWRSQLTWVRRLKAVEKYSITTRQKNADDIKKISATSRHNVAKFSSLILLNSYAVPTNQLFRTLNASTRSGMCFRTVLFRFSDTAQCH